MEQGLIQVYTGEGKGKTSAATGLAVRALGQGLRVLLVRFLKPQEPASGEILFLQGTPGLEILTAGVGIIDRPVDPPVVARSVVATFERARQKMAEEKFDLLILDEINNVLHRGYLPLQEFLAFLDGRPEGLEIVLTGRNAPAAVLERAHLVTRMTAEKHPLQQGIPARRGIEF